MRKIAIIDDDIHIGDMLTEVLTQEGYAVLRAYSGTEALYLLSQNKPDLVLLDLMLPGLSGEEILPHIDNIPVIVLSAKVDVQDKVNLLLSGAADYMTKPFSKTVLVSKIRAIVRRTQQYTTPSIPPFSGATSDSMQTIVQRGPFTLHLDTQTVFKNDKEISLSSKEFALLCFFIDNAETLITKQEIFSKVWKGDSPDNNTILVYTKRLRDKIEDNPAKPKPLTTVWGKGYQFFL